MAYYASYKHKKEEKTMRKAVTFLLVMVVILTILCSCNKSDNYSNSSSVLNSQQQNSSSVTQSVSSTVSVPATNKSENSQPVSSSDTTETTEVKKETIWKLIDENKVEDITPVFENLRYIIDDSDWNPNLNKNIDYGVLSFFKVGGKTGVVDYQGEIKIPYEDNVSWCIEGFVDAHHNKYDSEFRKETAGGHGVDGSYLFDLNTYKLVDDTGEGWPEFVDIDYYIKNNHSLSGIYKCAYFKADKDMEFALNMEKETDFFIVLDEKGVPITEPNIQEGTGFYDGISAIKKDNKWGFISVDGNMLLDFQYDYAYNFMDDIAAVCKDGKWGYINKDGSVYKDFVFDATRSFFKGKAWVKLNGKWQIITK